ncbi:MAG: helix-turn-helix transcriptional regulator [Bacteroidales bacterium]
MKDRIIRFMTAEGLSSSKLADEIGVQRSSVSHLLGGRNNPSYEFIHKMLSRFPRLNAEWLILGTGQMYKDMFQSELFSQPQSQPKSEMKESVAPHVEIEPFLPEETPVNTPPQAAAAIVTSSTEAEKPEKKTNDQTAIQMILVYADNTFRVFSLAE